MNQRTLLAALMLLVAAGCTQVVTSTTSEIRPMRYALIDFTQQLPLQDSAIVFAQRALAAEKIVLQPGDVSGGVIVGGPVHFNAEGDLPVLQATITITAATRGAETKFRIYAASVMPAGATGGVDARLMTLVQRLSQRISAMVSP